MAHRPVMRWTTSWSRLSSSDVCRTSRPERHTPSPSSDVGGGRSSPDASPSGSPGLFLFLSFFFFPSAPEAAAEADPAGGAGGGPTYRFRSSTRYDGASSPPSPPPPPPSFSSVAVPNSSKTPNSFVPFPLTSYTSLPPPSSLSSSLSPSSLVLAFVPLLSKSSRTPVSGTVLLLILSLPLLVLTACCTPKEPAYVPPAGAAPGAGNGSSASRVRASSNAWGGAAWEFSYLQFPRMTDRRTESRTA
mmetsp:Transcript_4855/g.10944  ORF Transcript_4855/g.10944 Transcript_4855/m.10944 type:complete len:246 (-) Transcript_4855:630-1367(-)